MTNQSARNDPAGCVKSLCGVDLNLLVVFMAIYKNSSVSRAAVELGLGQPAVSNSLAKLRVLFDDPLFIRKGKGVTPTDNAYQIAEILSPLLSNIRSLLNP